MDLLYKALNQYNIELPKHHITSDRFTRWGDNARYWARAVEDGFVFGDYVNDISESVFPKSDKSLSSQEIEKRRKEIEKARAEQEKEQNRTYKETSKKAQSIWQNASKEVPSDFPYIVNKQIEPLGLRFSSIRSVLIIPLYGVDENNQLKLWSLQFINKDGDKRFLFGGKKKGCYFSIGEPKNSIIICEGVATGLSIYKCTQRAVAVAFDKGNLESVIKTLQSKYPTLELIIAADNDIKEDAPNIGVEEAQRVGSKYGYKVIVPSLKSSGKCDFNDLMIAEGQEAVKKCFEDTSSLAIQEENKLPEGYCLTDEYLLYTGGESDPIRVSGKIEVIAKTRDDNSQNWGKLISFVDPDGIKKEIAIPNTMFAADCRELRERLLSEGLDITPAGKSKLSTYLMSCNPSKRALCINKTGWYKGVYVLPDEVIGKSNELISFQTESINNVYTYKGKVSDWINNIGRYCQGNSRLIFAVSLAFASSLLELSDLESGGFHFVGGSSCGKSTILKVAASVWGGKDYLRTWRTTDNGLEGVANLHNDSLLVLDELGQVSPEKAGEIAYMLGNGNGKTRANRNGNAKNTYSWRLLFLSSGEKDLSDCAEESKKKIKAGQEIRLLNIPAIPNHESFGAFENIHNFSDGGKFAEYLNRSVKQSYGTPSRKFIEYIAQEEKGKLKKWLQDNLSSIKKEIIEAIEQQGQKIDTQVGRAINRFALVALAGEYATSKGLTGWNEGDVLTAIATCFKDWLASRGGLGNQEDKAILEQVKYFLEQNSESRFLDLTKDKGDKIINMAGYKDKPLNEWEYYVLPMTFKKDICSGFNPNLVKNVLSQNGWLVDSESQVKKINGKSVRVYTFSPKIWEC